MTPPTATELLEELERARDLGFLGPGPVEEHQAHAHAFGAALGDALGDGGGPGARLLDLGSGGGVPGLVLACSTPMGAWTLLDSSVRRTSFLREATEALGLRARVTVLIGRAEAIGAEASHRQAYDGVTARGFGPPAVVAECAAPLLRPGGVLVVSEPPAGRAQAAHRWPVGPLAMVGMAVEEQVVGPPTFVVLRQVQPCPSIYPRRTGVPAKRPLW